MTAHTDAHNVLDVQASQELLDQVREIEQSGQADWIYDPSTRQVVGLVENTPAQKCLVVVYLDVRDFEVHADLEG